jgi:hypothetical protein
MRSGGFGFSSPSPCCNDGRLQSPSPLPLFLFPISWTLSPIPAPSGALAVRKDRCAVRLSLLRLGSAGVSLLAAPQGASVSTPNAFRRDFDRAAHEILRWGEHPIVATCKMWKGLTYEIYSSFNLRRHIACFDWVRFLARSGSCGRSDTYAIRR